MKEKHVPRLTQDQANAFAPVAQELRRALLLKQSDFENTQYFDLSYATFYNITLSRPVKTTTAKEMLDSFERYINTHLVNEDTNTHVNGLITRGREIIAPSLTLRLEQHLAIQRGQEIRQRRKSLGLSLKELGQQAGLSGEHVYQIEKRCSKENWVKLHPLLGLDEHGNVLEELPGWIIQIREKKAEENAFTTNEAAAITDDSLKEAGAFLLRLAGYKSRDKSHENGRG